MPMQVRFQSSAQRAAELRRSRSRNAGAPTDLVRPVGVVSGTSVGGTRKPRTSQKASPCLCTRADGSQYEILPRTRTTATRTTKPAASKVWYPPEVPHRTTAADLPALHCD